MTRCETLEERTCGTEFAALMPNSASLFNFVRDVEAIPFPFARSPSTRYPFPSFARESAPPSAPSESYAKSMSGQPDCPFSLTHLIVWEMETFGGV